MINLLDLDRDDIAALIDDKPYRASQIFEWVFGKYVTAIDEMTNLSKDLRQQLSEKAGIFYPEVVGRQTSSDGTEKFAYRTHDGHVIESVLIPDGDHWTVCVSSQVGCSMGCRFCYTARLGFKRNLTVGEIVAQIICPRRTFPERHIRNVVFMGMGEPLLNYDNVIKAIRIITDNRGPDFSTRRITVSTCGIVPGIEKLSDELPIGLAVSLNSSTDEQRSYLMPINKKYPQELLLATLKKYPLANRRRITIEYVLLGGVNDSVADARRLVRLLHGIKVKVNLIPFNPWPGSELQAPTADAVQAFEDVLRDSPLTVMLRREKGKDILAACGQLAGGVNE